MFQVVEKENLRGGENTSQQATSSSGAAKQQMDSEERRREEEDERRKAKARENALRLQREKVIFLTIFSTAK